MRRNSEQNFTTIVRKALGGLFENQAWLKGRCWGFKRKTNPFSGANIVIAISDELISISRGLNGKLRIHEFVRRDEIKQPVSILGDLVRKELKKANLDLEE